MNECKKFKKLGRGKPARNSCCLECSVIWHQHYPRIIKVTTSKKPEIAKTTFLEPVKPLLEHKHVLSTHNERSPEEDARIKARIIKSLKVSFKDDYLTYDEW